jgi:hypothetical protein
MGAINMATQVSGVDTATGLGIHATHDATLGVGTSDRLIEKARISHLIIMIPSVSDHVLRIYRKAP